MSTILLHNRPRKAGLGKQVQCLSETANNAHALSPKALLKYVVLCYFKLIICVTHMVLLGNYADPTSVGKSLPVKRTEQNSLFRL